MVSTLWRVWESLPTALVRLTYLHVLLALNIILSTLTTRSHNEVVCYCSVGYRSSSFAQKLFSNHRKSIRPSEHEDAHSRSSEQKDDLDIYNLDGGVFQWACEGREIVNEAGEKASTVHPYSSFWGRLLPAKLRHKM